jgi:plastocyanin
MKRPGPTLALLLSLSLALGSAACGGGDDNDGAGLSNGDNAADGQGDETTGDTTATTDQTETGAPDITLPDEVVPLTTDPADVRAIDNSFDAEGVKVPAGTTVRWTNAGRQDHDVIPADGGDWGAEVEAFHPGDTYEHTFTEPGTYSYYCTIHGTSAKGMVGVVVVE